MLKRLKECQHQQKKEVIYLLGVSGTIKLDLRITNVDASSNIHRKPEAVLFSHEREIKKKYLQVYLDQHRHFSPFVVGCM